MGEEFMSDRAIEPQNHDRESVRILIVGSRRGITNIIHTLYALGFAEIREWSSPTPEPNSGKLMSVTTKHFAIDSD